MLSERIKQSELVLDKNRIKLISDQRQDILIYFELAPKDGNLKAIISDQI